MTWKEVKRGLHLISDWKYTLFRTWRFINGHGHSPFWKSLQFDHLDCGHNEFTWPGVIPKGCQITLFAVLYSTKQSQKIKCKDNINCQYQNGEPFTRG